MKSNNKWKAILLVAILTIGLSRAALTESTSEPKTVKLFARGTPITLGRTVEVAALTQANGEQGYSPLEAEGFHLEGCSRSSNTRMLTQNSGNRTGTPSELENPLELNNATAFWKEMTTGLFGSSEPAISR
jgi:hypothetical protein